MNVKRILITGATSGIGREAASQIARTGAALILGCRDVAKGNATADEIEKETGAPRPLVFELDTADQRSIRTFATTLKRSVDRLDVLVNNAGTNQPVRVETADRIERTFATNVLGYHLLTNELLELLAASAPARIVNVASEFAGELEFDDLEFKRRPYKPVTAYRQSKQANRMLTWALARRLSGTRTTANALTPGLVWTGLYRNMTGIGRIFLRGLSAVRGRTVERGADTVTWLATSSDVEGVSGKFWDQRREQPCQFRGERDEERLLEACDSYVARSLETAG